jgi:hypothetical protein
MESRSDPFSVARQSTPDVSSHLFDLYTRCSLSFAALLTALDDSKRDFSGQLRRKDVESEFDKLKLWAKSVGAKHSGEKYRYSLDYRLRQSPFYRDRVRLQTRTGL